MEIGGSPGAGRTVTARAESRLVAPYVEPGEHVHLEARPHAAALAFPLARAVALALIGAALVLVGSPVAWPLGALGAVALATGALLALGAVWQWDRTLLVLTTEKVFVVYGIVRRRGAAVRLAGVAAIEVEQSLLGRLLGYGTLVAGDFEIPYVPNARDLDRLLA